MAKTVRICFLGPQKAGKTSLIRVLFGDTKTHEIKNLESTLVVEKSAFDFGCGFRAEVTEIPALGSETDFNLQADSYQLENQDIFVYVINCQNFNPENELKSLKEVFDCTHDKNPDSWFYIFYHQMDLQLFINYKDYEQDYFLEQSFQYHLRQKLNENEKVVQFYRTSLYDYSARFRMSQLLTSFFGRNSNFINMLLGKLNQQCKTSKIYIFDSNKELFLFNSSPDITQGNTLGY